jgi:hypothetical protein
MRDITLLFEGREGGVAELQCSEVSPAVKLCPFVLPIKMAWRQGRRSGSDESKAMRSAMLSTQQRKEV